MSKKLKKKGFPIYVTIISDVIPDINNARQSIDYENKIIQIRIPYKESIKKESL